VPPAGHHHTCVATSSLVKCSCSTTFRRSSFSNRYNNQSKICKVMFLLLNNGWRFPVVLHSFPSLHETNIRSLESLECDTERHGWWFTYLLLFLWSWVQILARTQALLTRFSSLSSVAPRSCWYSAVPFTSWI
jgi:hypothetical protein